MKAHTYALTAICLIVTVSNGAASAGDRYAGEEQDDNGLAMRLVWCPPGNFLMGSPSTENGRQSNEKQVFVSLDHGFWLGKYEVTQSQWRAVMGSSPWRGGRYERDGDKYPATYVSWNDASEFCRKFTASERAAGRLGAKSEYRLPDEQQWEYACRAGTRSTYNFGDDPGQMYAYAWFGGLLGPGSAQTQQYAHPVGRKRANAWGLHDMHGNVAEWCRNWYSDSNQAFSDNDAYASSGVEILSALRDVIDRVTRGGSWTTYPLRCRSAYRLSQEPAFFEWGLGFRVACIEIVR